MYLTPTEQHWACDIEADNLLDKAKEIHCVCVINCKTKEERSFRTAADMAAWLTDDIILVGHHFIGYDVVMLNRFWKLRIPITRVVDTYVLSQLYNPSYRGGHSLAAWGERLRYPKSKHDDFSHFTPEMLKYCVRDTRLAALLFLRLSSRMQQVGFTEEGCELEHLAWNIIQNKQKRNGFPFNKKVGEELYLTLRSREEELKNEIYKLWPPQFREVKSFANARKKNGDYTKNYERHREQYPELREHSDGRYSAYDWVEFNLGSPAQRIEKLLELGWVPTQFTKKKNPKVDEDSLLAFAELRDTPELKALAKWIVVNSRANMLNTWLEAYDEETGAIHGKLLIASTLRYRHNSPNSANIPAVRLKKIDGVDHILYGEEGAWTYECRDLWTCGDPSEWSLVGVDGKGIQLRVLANYAYSEEFASRVLDGDPHTNNIKILGLANKAAAKKFLYTTLMGGQGARLAADQAQFGTTITEKEGRALREKLIASVPGFDDLIQRLEKELEETGRIRLCDGTPILVPSPHMVIPYLLQGDESRLMKKALILLDEAIRRLRLSPHILKVADIHDEWQWRVRNEYVDKFIEIALPPFIEAGRFFNYRIPIEGDYKIGKTWAETH